MTSDGAPQQSQVYRRQRVTAPTLPSSQTLFSGRPPPPPQHPPPPPPPNDSHTIDGMAMLERFETAKTTIASDENSPTIISKKPRSRIVSDPNILRKDERSSKSRNVKERALRRAHTDGQVGRNEGRSSSKMTRANPENHLKTSTHIYHALAPEINQLSPNLRTKSPELKKEKGSENTPLSNMKEKSSRAKGRFAETTPLPSITPTPFFETASGNGSDNFVQSPIFRMMSFDTPPAQDNHKSKLKKREVRLSKISGPVSITRSTQPLLVTPDDPLSQNSYTLPVIDPSSPIRLPNLTTPPVSPPKNDRTDINIIPPLPSSSPPRSASPVISRRSSQSSSRSRERRRGKGTVVNRRSSLSGRKGRSRRNSIGHASSSQKRKDRKSRSKRSQKRSPKRPVKETFLPAYDDVSLGDSPPFSERLHPDFDLVSFDPRYHQPVIRFNRRLITSRSELKVTITKLSQLKLVPDNVDLEDIRRIDDRKFAKVLPELIGSRTRRRERHQLETAVYLSLIDAYGDSATPSPQMNDNGFQPSSAPYPIHHWPL